MKGINKVKLFLDGVKVQSGPFSMMSTCSSGTKLNVAFGGSACNSDEVCSWDLGPTLLMESAIKAHAIYYIFLRGAEFRGTHEGSIPVPATVQCIALRERLLKIMKPSMLQSALTHADEASEYVKNTSDLGAVCLKVMAHHSRNEITVFKNGSQSSTLELIMQDGPTSLDCLKGRLVDGCTAVNPIGIVDSLRSIGCIETILPFLGRVSTSIEVKLNLHLLSLAIQGNESNLDTLSRINGYKILAFLLHRAFNMDDILNGEVLDEVLTLVSGDAGSDDVPGGLLTNPNFVRHILVSHEVWRCLDSKLRLYLLQKIFRLVAPVNPNAAFNAMSLNRLDAISWLLHTLLDLREDLNSDIITTTIGLVMTLMKYLISPLIVNAKELSLLDRFECPASLVIIFTYNRNF